MADVAPASLPNSLPNSLPASPCVRNCCLDPRSDICVGCFRSIDEIIGWQQADGPERTAILQRCAQRQRAHQDAIAQKRAASK